MPTYEYRCECGVEFEEFQSITADPVANCPECGKPAERLISGGTGLIFKGSGFYITDYKAKNASNGEAAEAKVESSSSSDTSSTDAKSSDTSKKDNGPKGSASSDSKPSSKANAA